MATQRAQTEEWAQQALEFARGLPSSFTVLEYQEALRLTLAKEPQIDAKLTPTPPRPSVEIPRHRTVAEELSFRLFDGQSLQYSDKIVDGFYDIWGEFSGTQVNTPVALFPTLRQLGKVQYAQGDVREVLVFDSTRDPQVGQLTQAAKQIVESKRSEGALVCVQELAVLVSNTLGGPATPEALSQLYREMSSDLTDEKQSVVRYLGNLGVGLSRHRALLLKALADTCGLPCRLLRGDFYLGAAGTDGENAVTIVQFNNQEYMVELVTEPGRVYQLKSGSIPQPTTDALWGKDTIVRAGSAEVQQASAHSYPTVPRNSEEGQIQEEHESNPVSEASSASQKDGLAWGDADGPTMEDLDASEASSIATGMDTKSSSLETAGTDKRSIHSGEDQLTGLQRRLSLQRARSISQSHPSNSSGPETGEDYKAWIARQGSSPVPSIHHDKDSEDSANWEPWEQADDRKISLDIDDSEGQVAVIQPCKYGSNPSTGPARARVRGTDHRGRIVEFELEGLTVTHAHNLQLAPKVFQARQSEDTPSTTSLESMISRYRIKRPARMERMRRSAESGTTNDVVRPDSGRISKSLGTEDLPDDTIRLRLHSLALKTDGGEEDAKPKGTSSLTKAGSPGLSSTQKQEGKQWEQDMRNATEDRKSSSVQNSPSRLLGASPNIASLLSNPSLQRSKPRSSNQQDQEDSRARRTSSSVPERSEDQRPGTNLGHKSDRYSQSTVSSGLSRAEQNQLSLSQQVDLVKEDITGSNRALEERQALVAGRHSSETSRATGISNSTEQSGQRGAGDTSMSSIESQAFLRSLNSSLTAREGRLESLGSQVSLIATEDEIDVDFNEIDLGPRIGIGCFGEVFKARWRQTTVAVKRLFDQSLSEQSLREFRAEVQLNRRIKHPNVIMFMGACTVPPNLSIITQWASRGSLFHLLHSSKPGRPPLTLRQKLRMALDISRGMHYLHSARPPIIHRDLKSMNLLVDNDLTIKVCDFGLARTRSSTWVTGRSQGGTPEWTAPEVLRNWNYNEKSDVYSFGVVLYELATEKEPWDDMTPMQVVGAVGWGGNRLEPPPDCPQIFADLMRRCFKSPEERPSFEEAIQILLDYANETKPSKE